MAAKIPGVKVASSRSTSACPWAPTRDGLRLAVRLTPRAAADEVIGLTDGPDRPHVAVKVRALPSEGAANAALERLVARWLGLAQRDVALVGGDKSRLKTLLLSGDPGELAERLQARLAP